MESPQCITSSTSGFSENVTHYDFPLHVYHQRHSFIALYHSRETKSESFASCRVWVNIFGGSEKFSVNVRHPQLEVLLLRFCELNFRKMKSSNWKLYSKEIWFFYVLRPPERVPSRLCNTGPAQFHHHGPSERWLLVTPSSTWSLASALPRDFSHSTTKMLSASFTTWCQK